MVNLLLTTIWSLALNSIRAQVGAPAPITSALRRRKTQRVFHVCPLLLRHRMDGGADRAVYKYVFSCPGEAQIMVGTS